MKLYHHQIIFNDLIMILISNHYDFINYKNIFEYKIAMLLLLITALILIIHGRNLNKSIGNHRRIFQLLYSLDMQRNILYS